MPVTPENNIPDNATFRAIVDQSMDGILVHRDAQIVYANAALERIYGFAPGTMLGINPHMLLVEDDRAQAIARAERRLKGEASPRKIAFRVQRPDGRQIDIEAVAFVVDWAGGPAVAVSISDVTTRNFAIARKNETEDFILKSLENAPLPSLIIADDCFKFANASARELFERQGESLVGQSATSLYVDPEMRQAALDTAVNQGVIDGMEAEMVRRDGVSIPCLIYTVMTTYAGRPAFFTNIVDQSEHLAAQAYTQRTEAMLTAVMEHAPVGFAFRDMSGRFELINQRNAAHWGRPVEEIIGRRPEDFAAPEAAQWCRILDDEAVRTGKMEREATFAYDPDEGVRRIRTIRFPVRDGTGELLGVANFALDITTEWRAQEAMKVAEAESRRTARILNLIVKHAPIAFCYRDKHRRLRMLNPLAADWVGHSEEEARGKTLEELPNFLGVDQMRDIDIRAFENHETFDESIRMKMAGGRMLTVRAIGFPVFENSGVLAGVCNIAMDHSQIVAVQDLLSATLDAARFPIMRTDDRGIIESFNPAAEEAFGYTAAEAIGQESFMVLHEKDLRVHREALVRLQQDSEAPFIGRIFELEAVRKDGSTLMVELCVGEAIVDGQRKFIGTFRDMTELHATEQQLRQAQKMEAVGQLTGGIAHDFNNLIAVISGNLELLQESEGLGERQRGLIESAQRASGRGADLTARLLSFSRHRPIALETFDVSENARAALGMLTRAIGTGIRLHLDGEPGLYVRSDPAQFDTAILNLAVNARDAMPDGGDIRISIRRSSRAGEVVIAVCDSGTGMPEEVWSRAFEPFYTTKDVGKGSGLGLSMVYGFAKQSEGRALIRPGDEGGTCVEIHLPLIDPEVGTRGPASAENTVVNAATILILDPDPSDAARLAQELGHLGHEAVCFRDADRAVGFMRLTRKVDFLLVADTLARDAGTECPLRWVWENRPEVRGIRLASGTASKREGVMDTVDVSYLPELRKPFMTSDLIGKFGDARETKHHVL